MRPGGPLARASEAIGDTRDLTKQSGGSRGSGRERVSSVAGERESRGPVTGRRLERQAEWLRPAGTGRGEARMAFEERRRRLGGSSVTDARWHSGHSYTPETEDLPSCVQLYKVSEQ